MNFEILIKEANPCPVCDQLPVITAEPGFEEVMTFLRCPAGHPYVACGQSLLEAVNQWNRYIELHHEQDRKHMIARHNHHVQRSYCRHCQKFTPSLMQFTKEQDEDNHLKYVVVKQECTNCHLTKSQQDAA